MAFPNETRSLNHRGRGGSQRTVREWERFAGEINVFLGLRPLNVFLPCLKQKTTCPAYCEGHAGSDHDPPCPGNFRSEPEVELNGESAEHADHGARLISAASEGAQQEGSQERAVCDRGDLQADFYYASHFVQCDHG